MTPELKVAASASRANGTKRWLVDTGCPLDLIAEYEIGQDEKEYIKPATDSVRLNTANGITKANRIIKYRVDGMEDGIEAFVLSSTPTVMSVGKRCMERGYDFIWKAGETPYLVPPSGRRMMLDVINNMPYLPVCSSTACAVASISQPIQTCFGSDSCYSIDDLSIDWGSDIDCSPAASDDEAGVDNRAVRDLKAEAKSLRHLMTHLQKNPYCDSCQRAKMVNVHHKQGGGIDKFKATEFGEHITGDTLVLHGR